MEKFQLEIRLIEEAPDGTKREVNSAITSFPAETLAEAIEKFDRIFGRRG